MAKKVGTNAHGLELTAKMVPVQARALDTVEMILETAGLVLEEAGFEQLSTNLVAQRAKISVPALYRYFPNKYAILNALGDRILQRQDQAVLAWLQAGGLVAETTRDRIANVHAILKRVLEITRDFPGNIAITRALRAVPAMRESRLDARNGVTAALDAVVQTVFPTIPAATRGLATKLCLELMQAAVDMVLEEPGPDTDAILLETAKAFVVYFETLARTAESGEL